jgi:hypothetical protein
MSNILQRKEGRKEGRRERERDLNTSARGPYMYVGLLFYATSNIRTCGGSPCLCSNSTLALTICSDRLSSMLTPSLCLFVCLFGCQNHNAMDPTTLRIGSLCFRTSRNATYPSVSLFHQSGTHPSTTYLTNPGPTSSSSSSSGAHPRPTPQRDEMRRKKKKILSSSQASKQAEKAKVGSLDNHHA